MEAQLQWLVKAVNDKTDVVSKEMKKSAYEGFMEVISKLDYVYNIVLQRVLESTVVQEYFSISTEPWARNVQIPPTAIDVEWEDLNISL